MPRSLPGATLAGVHLRPVVPDDLPVLAGQVTEPSVARWWPRYDLARLAREVADPSDTSLVVEVGASVAGYVVLSEELDPDYRHGAVDLWLGRDWQGRGLGRQVVRAACRVLLDERGHHRLTIDPCAANTRAVACYRAVGFRPVGVLRAHERGPDGAWRDGLLLDLLAGELVDG